MLLPKVCASLSRVADILLVWMDICIVRVSESPPKLPAQFWKMISVVLWRGCLGGIDLSKNYFGEPGDMWDELFAAIWVFRPIFVKIPDFYSDIPWARFSAAWWNESVILLSWKIQNRKSWWLCWLGTSFPKAWKRARWVCIYFSFPGFKYRMNQPLSSLPRWGSRSVVVVLGACLSIH